MKAHAGFNLTVAKGMKLEDWKKMLTHHEDQDAVVAAWEAANPGKAEKTSNNADK